MTERRMAGSEPVVALLEGRLSLPVYGGDPRDYLIEPGVWRSQLLPYGVSIDQAIKDGVW